MKNDDEPLEGVTISVEGKWLRGWDTETGRRGPMVGSASPRKGDVRGHPRRGYALPKGVIVKRGRSKVAPRVRLRRRTTVAFFLGEGQRARGLRTSSPSSLQRLISGVNFGLLLALAAIGLSLIFGTTGLSNFARRRADHIRRLMVLTFGVNLAWPLWLAVSMALVLSAASMRPRRGDLETTASQAASRLVQLMIGASALARPAVHHQLFYGGSTSQLRATLPSTFSFGAVALSWIDIASMAVSIVVLLGSRTSSRAARIGRSGAARCPTTRACAASSIDVDRVIRIVWVLGSLLAGLSCILVGLLPAGVSWDMGFQILLLVFAAVTLGGLGTAFGALVGSHPRRRVRRAVDALAAE